MQNSVYYRRSTNRKEGVEPFVSCFEYKKLYSMKLQSGGFRYAPIVSCRYSQNCCFISAYIYPFHIYKRIEIGTHNDHHVDFLLCWLDKNVKLYIVIQHHLSDI